MNNTKFFIVLALILGAVVAVGEVFFVFFGGKGATSDITASSINLLPEKLDVEGLQSFVDRAGKYLVLKPKQFEDGVDPATLENTPTPTPTE